jgi:hypothetical protein
LRTATIRFTRGLLSVVLSGLSICRLREQFPGLSRVVGFRFFDFWGFSHPNAQKCRCLSMTSVLKKYFQKIGKNPAGGITSARLYGKRVAWNWDCQSSVAKVERPAIFQAVGRVEIPSANCEFDQIW